MTFPPLIIWAKALFFFEQFFPVVARTWLGLKSGPLFWAQNFGFCPVGGCGARAVSRKTPIYFILNASKATNNSSGEKGKSLSFETNLVLCLDRN